MTEPMTGSDNLQKCSKKWIDLQSERLDKWEQSIGIGKFGIPAGKEDAIHFLECSSEDRSKLTPEECADAVIVLAQYAAYVGRAAQRMESDSFLLKEQITRLLGSSVAEQKAYSPEERRTLALCQHEECYNLDAERIASFTKAKRLYQYADRIDKVAKAYETLSYGRKRERQYGN